MIVVKSLMSTSALHNWHEFMCIVWNNKAPACLLNKPPRAHLAQKLGSRCHCMRQISDNKSLGDGFVCALLPSASAISRFRARCTLRPFINDFLCMVSGHSFSWSAVHCETESYALKDAICLLQPQPKHESRQSSRLRWCHFWNTEHCVLFNRWFCCLFLSLSIFISDKNPLSAALHI